MANMQIHLDHIDPQTSRISTFWFKPERPIRYVAGQYVEMTLKHAHPDDRGQKRWFTLSSSPNNSLLSITTKYDDVRSSTFKQALFALDPGAELDITEPMGDFVLPKDPRRPLIFVAGGIGITPFHSIVSWLAEEGEQRNIRFLYAVHSEDEILFEDTFQKAGIHMTIIVNQPSDAWGGERGRLTPEMILGLSDPTDNTLAFLSGPEPMIESLAEALKPRLGKTSIVLDYFPGYRDV